MESGMNPSTDKLIAQMDGGAALPRLNGDLVFESPWEGRAFGLAVSLVKQGGYEWEDFRRLLVAHIAKGEGRPDEPAYYESWLAALLELAISKRLTTEDELDRKMEELADSQGEEWAW